MSGRRVAGRADVADDVARRDALALAQARRVALQVGVVVAERSVGIELVDGDPARLAVEQLGDGAVLDRDDRRVPRRQDVDRFVRPRVRRRGAVRSCPSVVDSTSTSHRRRGSRRSCRRRIGDRIGADRLASVAGSIRRAARRPTTVRPARRLDSLTRPLGRGRRGVSAMRLAERRAKPPARRHAGVEAGDERGNDTPAARVPSGSFENHRRPRLATSAASRAASQLVSRTQPCDCGVADLSTAPAFRAGRSARCRYRSRPTPTGLFGPGLIVPCVRRIGVPEQIGVVVKRRHPVDASHLPLADRQRIVLAAARDRREQRERSVVADHLQRSLARDLDADQRTSRLLPDRRLRGVVERLDRRDLDRVARGESRAGIQPLEQRRRRVETLAEALEERLVSERGQLRLCDEIVGNRLGKWTGTIILS